MTEIANPYQGIELAPYVSDMSVRRWRYKKSDGTPVWVAFDPDRPCIYCQQPVRALSTGGPLVCSPCDCGVSRETGKKWTPQEALSVFYPRANKAIDELPNDPAWAVYERAFANRKQHG